MKWTALLFIPLLSAVVSRGGTQDADDSEPSRRSRTIPLQRDLFNWGIVGSRTRLRVSEAPPTLTTSASNSTNANRRRFEYNLVVTDPATGHLTTHKRCLVCPANTVVVTSLRCNCARMRRPVVRPCSESGADGTAETIRTKIVEGPLPGSLVAEGSHRVVLHVLDPRSGKPVHSCRFTQTVVVKRCPALALTPAHKVNCTAGHRLNSRCHVQCQPGRILRGRANLSCVKRPDGRVQWSHPTPVCSAVCPAAPIVLNSRISCSLNPSASDGSTLCKYVCDQDYVIPRSQRKLQYWSCSSDGRWNSTIPPQCARMERPVPIGQQCRDLNVTLDETTPSIELSAPRFRSAFGAGDASTVNVTCDVNSISSGGKFERRCVAVDTELDTRASCHYVVHAVVKKCRPLKAPQHGSLKCDAKNDSVLICHLECDIGYEPVVQGVESPVSLSDRTAYCHLDQGVWLIGRHKWPVTDLDCEPDPPAAQFEAQLHFRMVVELPSCGDRHALDNLRETIKSALVQRNADVCREANCSHLELVCQASDPALNLKFPVTVEAIWTVSADYSPIEDYYYEGTDVPEGESLIEKIQVETESIVRADIGFHGHLRQFGAHVQEHSYRVGKLDLVCHLPGYVINESTNKCKKCPVNTFQSGGRCVPCSRGTFQPSRGQTRCRSCPDKDDQLSGRFSTCQNLSHPSSLSSRLTNAISRSGFSSRSRLRPDPSRHSYPLGVGSNKLAVVSNRLLVRSGRPPPASPSDPCRPNPCKSGGRCIKYGTEAKCSCPIGYSGTYCERAECLPLACFHGGTCVVRDGQWRCLCRDEFTGNRCQHLQRIASLIKPPSAERLPHPTSSEERSLHPTMGFCASNPCRNGGRCVDNSQAGYFTCLCTPRFLGRLCQYRPCVDQGTSPCPIGSRCVTDTRSGGVQAARLCLCPTHLKHPQCTY